MRLRPFWTYGLERYGMSIERHDFTSGTELAQSLSEAIADKLSSAIAERGHATIAVSGGTTPLKLFDILSRKMIDWTLVTITLVDERFVAPTNERSNEKLVRDHLLRDQGGRKVMLAAMYHAVRHGGRALALQALEHALAYQRQGCGVGVLGVQRDRLGRLAGLVKGGGGPAYALHLAAPQRLAWHGDSGGVEQRELDAR